MAVARLHETPPREQVGAGTGPLFEYQYTQAAVDSLLLFEDALCVYCEWHDDYVIEFDGILAGGKSPVYRFHQVKTKGLSDGPWTLNALFGTNSKKKPSAQDPPKTQPFQHMLEHAINFADRCDRLVFVTNNDVHNDVRDLLANVRAVPNFGALANATRMSFDRIFAVHKHVQAALTEARLFEVLQRLEVVSTRGNPDHGTEQLIVLGVKIANVSEVDLSAAQAERMGRDILDVVRAKSGVKIEPLPAGFTDDDLKAKKAIVVEDLLELISLSPEGYKILKASGAKSPLLGLSRLQRYCKQNAIGPELIQDICRYKAEWDAWLISEKARIDPLDLTALQAECGSAVSSYGVLEDANKSIAWFVPKAREIATSYARLNTLKPLTADCILGLVFKIAADRGLP